MKRRSFFKSALVAVSAYLGGRYFNLDRKKIITTEGHDMYTNPNRKKDSDYYMGDTQTVNPDQTFDTFVVGRNNEFAHAACIQFASSPLKSDFNLLYICGPVGFGKTHLANAIANHIASHSSLKAIRVSTESLINQFVRAIRRGEMSAFRKKYRTDFDVVILDDAQLIGRGESFQEEVIHTANSLFEQGKKMVILSDVFPKEIVNIDKRLVSIFEGGLIADIPMPDMETRIAIIKYKAEKQNVVLNDEAIKYIASKSSRSLRQIEGNLAKVKTYSELHGLPINLDLVQKILS